MIICIYEDRIKEIPGIKLLILSLTKHCPELSIALFCPFSDDAFNVWIKNIKQVNLDSTPVLNAGSYDIKPTIILRLLAAGWAQVLWLDSDIIVRGNLNAFLQPFKNDTLIYAQDPWECPNAGTNYAIKWGLSVGRRNFPGSINTCFLRVTQLHAGLMVQWMNLLTNSVYLSVQARSPAERPAHLLSDQSVLTALLCSTDFALLSISKLELGKQIIQQHGLRGYSIRERFHNFRFGLPIVIHSMGPKPWHYKEPPSLFSVPSFLNSLYLELSPYASEAQQYRNKLDEDSLWLNIRSRTGRFLNAISFGNPSLRGVVLVALAECANYVRVKISKFRILFNI